MAVGLISEINEAAVARAMADQVLRGEKLSASGALRQAGYAPSYAVQPGRVTARPSFRALLEKMLPDKLLLTQHKEGILTQNLKTRKGYVEMAYKLKGYLVEHSEPDIGTVVINWGGDPPIEGRIVEPPESGTAAQAQKEVS